MLRNPIARLRLVCLLEGVSFLLLLGIAMPLKYLAAMPLAVRVTGMVHGLLFIAVCVLAFHVSKLKGWGSDRALQIIVAALLPFGPFVLDRSLRKAQREG
ncbi:MAG: DUF3817 domain-containing protein [Proteobacteria bacterium]|nr:DUF3817 domain-containing protein [Pseudomonadota bacterium]